MRHLPKIGTQTIPHNAQMYDTAGDYGECKVVIHSDNKTINEKGWFINLSKMERWEYEALVLVHELVEMILTKQRGIKWKDIDKFDKDGEGKDHDDPGMLKLAPYHKEHLFAVKVEKMLCKELGLDWETYDNSFSKLKY